ncbi:uncharacterized protein N7469_001191 [Penicillium citrinum]|uniref:Uncharacterized protein n=1 Tax=Penicillium citrinum TaxID=5077 RepID=A0A9W9PGG9_PENCI|nr:uncharacterized protein N7469_001191 [Penicillium citrinum]KAJ5242864.1 hypothetical protein N7469_001191 [Penicillium citrinum]
MPDSAETLRTWTLSRSLVMVRRASFLPGLQFQHLHMVHSSNLASLPGVSTNKRSRAMVLRDTIGGKIAASSSTGIREGAEVALGSVVSDPRNAP